VKGAMGGGALWGAPGATNQGARVKYEAWAINKTAPYCGFLQKVWFQSIVPCCMARLALLGEPNPPNPPHRVRVAGNPGAQAVGTAKAAGLVGSINTLRCAYIPP